MQKLIKTLLLIVIFYGSAFAQSPKAINGSWIGALDVSGSKLRLILHVTAKANIFEATLDSPDQGVKGILIDEIRFEKDTLKFSLTSIKASYVGVLKNDTTLDGVFRQMGSEFQLNLRKSIGGIAAIKRPQEPRKPYPYLEEEVSFENRKAGIRLTGTLTKPSLKKVYPVVLLISGSGAQDRDETILDHKPFLVLADYLTRKGIAVLRVDDRGVGKSTGTLNGTSGDFADDVEAGIEYLKSRKDLNSKKIGLIGHSEGGMIAPIVASRNKDVSFIVLMAGIGIPGGELLLSQTEEIYRKSGATEEEIRAVLDWHGNAQKLVQTINDSTQLKAEFSLLTKVFTTWPDERKARLGINEASTRMLQNLYTSNWMKFFLLFDPKLALKEVKVPVLALNGTKDVQVLADINLKGIEEGLKAGGNTKYQIKKLEGLNHLFQQAATGMMFEYGQIEQTIDPSALDHITDWVLETVN